MEHRKVILPASPDYRLPTNWATYWDNGDAYNGNISSVASDDEGNTYIGGWDEVAAKNYVAKLDKDGNQLWCNEIDGGVTFNNVEAIRGMAVDSNGNVVCAIDAGQIYVVSIDASGVTNWTKGYGNGTGDTISQVWIDNDDYIYFMSRSPWLIYEGDYSVIITKLDSLGNLQWHSAIASWDDDTTSDTEAYSFALSRDKQHIFVLCASYSYNNLLLFKLRTSDGDEVARKAWDNTTQTYRNNNDTVPYGLVVGPDNILYAVMKGYWSTTASPEPNSTGIIKFDTDTLDAIGGWVYQGFSSYDVQDYTHWGSLYTGGYLANALTVNRKGQLVVQVRANQMGHRFHKGGEWLVVDTDTGDIVNGVTFNSQDYYGWLNGIQLDPQDNVLCGSHCYQRLNPPATGFTTTEDNYNAVFMKVNINDIPEDGLVFHNIGSLFNVDTSKYRIYTLPSSGFMSTDSSGANTPYHETTTASYYLTDYSVTGTATSLNNGTKSAVINGVTYESPRIKLLYSGGNSVSGTTTWYKRWYGEFQEGDLVVITQITSRYAHYYPQIYVNGQYRGYPSWRGNQGGNDTYDVSIGRFTYWMPYDGELAINESSSNNSLYPQCTYVNIFRRKISGNPSWNGVSWNASINTAISQNRPSTNPSNVDGGYIVIDYGAGSNQYGRNTLPSNSEADDFHFSTCGYGSDTYDFSWGQGHHIWRTGDGGYQPSIVYPNFVDSISFSAVMAAYWVY